jgi:hypothetical protein
VHLLVDALINISSKGFKIASAFCLDFARERVKISFLISNVSADETTVSWAAREPRVDWVYVNQLRNTSSNKLH